MNLLHTSIKNSPKILLLLPLLGVAQAASAQEGAAEAGNSHGLVLLLFAVVMILAVFMAAILGDKIMKLTASKFLGDEAGTKVGLLPNGTELFPDANDPVAGKASKVKKLRRGFDIKLKGQAKKEFRAFHPTTYAVKPQDFPAMQPIPKMLVKQGDEVKAGDKLFHDRKMDKVFFTAPVSGEVVEIRRGEKRAITEVVILADKETKYKKFSTKADSREDVMATLVESGALTSFVERPFGIIANPEVQPKAIHISAFDTSPLAVDYNYIFDKVNAADFQAGLDAINKITDAVHLNMNAKKAPHAIFTNATGVHKNYFQGAHPAGNVGVQIHHIDPINKGETVWSIKPEDVVTIGKLFTTGKYDPVKYVAVGGDVLKNNYYVQTKAGANVENLLKDNLGSDNVRVVAGNVLTGTAIESNGFLGGHDNQVSVLEEGNFHEMFGWILPQYARPSISPTIPWSLTPFVKFEANTNTHGEKRAFVVSGQYEEVLPMDVYPQQLIKSIMYRDFDQMEGLGIYEMLEEDIALCEFVCTSKQPLQAILRDGLDFMHEQG